MLLSALFVRFRDIQPIWEVILQALFYATPILYPIETSPDKRRAGQRDDANPLAAIMEQTRHAIIDPSAPTAAEAPAGWRPADPGRDRARRLVLGFWVFNREAPRIAEEL